MEDIRLLQNGNTIQGIALDNPEGRDITLTEEIAGRIGGSFAYWLGFKVLKNPYDLRVAVGTDHKSSSDLLKAGLLKGLTMFGAEGYDAGTATGPAMFASTILPQFDFDGAVMITSGDQADHTNGFRFFTKNGEPAPDDIAEILRLASRYIFVGEYYEDRTVNIMQIYPAYLRQMLSQGLKDVPGYMEGIKAVIDPGCAANDFFGGSVLAAMGADIIENSGSMESLSAAVTGNDADMGIKFDCSGGIEAIVDGKGKIFSGDELIALAASIAAEDYPGGTVVTGCGVSDNLKGFLENGLGLRHVACSEEDGSAVSKASALQEDGEKVFMAADSANKIAFSDNAFIEDGFFLAIQIIINAVRVLKG